MRKKKKQCPRGRRRLRCVPTRNKLPPADSFNLKARSVRPGLFLVLASFPILRRDEILLVLDVQKHVPPRFTRTARRFYGRARSSSARFGIGQCPNLNYNLMERRRRPSFFLIRSTFKPNPGCAGTGSRTGQEIGSFPFNARKS